MRIFAFMTAPLWASAAMVTATFSVPSVSAAMLDGTVQTGGTFSTQPLANVHVTLFEATTAQPTGHPHDSVFFQQYDGSGPFGIVIAADGTAWVTNGGGLDGQNPRSVAKYALVNGALQQQFLHFLGQALKGLALDSQGNAWVTSQGNNTIYQIRPDGTEIGQFTGGGIYGPWEVAVDGEDNVWVANSVP